MIHSIYTSVSNADVVPCKKGQSIKSDPIPLLRDKYLGEYRTELEKAKVRKNLGIADDVNLQWGNISGFVEDQKDLIQYVESKWLYTNQISEDITNVKEALDYTIYFISNFKANNEAIVDLNEKFTTLSQQLSSVESDLNSDIQNNKKSIDEILLSIEEINKTINELNNALENLNVDEDIKNWIESKLENSQTINLSTTLDVTLSEKENNAIVVDNGLYVKDFTSEIQEHTNNISELQDVVQDVSVYNTTVSDNATVPTTIGGITQGTTGAQLKGKTIVEILDTMLFPAIVRELIAPTISYSHIDTLVKVGSVIIKPNLIFTQNDAGTEVSRTDSLTFNSQTVETQTYEELGSYQYNGSVTYNAGEYLVNNKGEVTNKRIEAGIISTSKTVVTTHPWFAGSKDSVSEQILVPFGQNSGIISLSLNNQSVIKLPGSKSTIISFKSDGGMGYLDVDLAGWTTGTETINGITYKTWTKNDSYVSSIPHQINFKLEL